MIHEDNRIELDAIRGRIESGEPLTFDDGVALYRHPDLFSIGRWANELREQKHGDKAFYVINRHINYSNVCAVTCLFCAFARRKGQSGGYTFSLDEVYQRAEELLESGGSELHIVGGLHPDLEWDYYLDMLTGIKQRVPDVHIKAFTAVEIDWFAEKFGKTHEDVLRELIDAGLDSLPGGGAEIFAEETRKKICRTKTNWEQWAQIHRAAHGLGIRSTCTMLYGHIESIEDRVDHMLRLRSIQDETGGFTAFIPLSFHPANTFMPEVVPSSGNDDLRTVAVSRLMLHNIDHIKVYWITLGLGTAQVALSYGADDLDGTVVEEKIYHMAGSTTPQHMAAEDLCRLIREAGRVPILRDSIYNEIHREEIPA